jgi:integrase
MAMTDDAHLSAFARRVLVRYCIERGELPADWKEERRMKAKITKRKIDQSQPGQKDNFLWDTELGGFGCKVTPSGKKTFVLQYRMPGLGRIGNARRFVLGVYPRISVEDARKLALEKLAEISKGHDPAVQQQKARAMEAEAKANTLAAVAEKYLERHGKAKTLSPKTLYEAKRYLLESDDLAQLRSRPIAQIRRRDLLELQDAIRDRKSNRKNASGNIVTANKVLTVLKRLFGWAVEREIIEQSPATGVRLLQATSRDRVLNESGVRSIWKAAAEIRWPYGPFVQLLLLTATRRNEVAGMQWSELSEDMTVWTLPRARTKTATSREIRLPEAAVAILHALPKVHERWVFAMTANNPMTDFSAAKQQIDARCGVTGWTFHDFRRSAATWLANEQGGGFQPHIIEAVLGHAPIKGVADIYNRNPYTLDCQRALEAWASYLGQAPQDTNVVRLRQA